MCIYVCVHICIHVYMSVFPGIFLFGRLLTVSSEGPLWPQRFFGGPCLHSRIQRSSDATQGFRHAMGQPSSQSLALKMSWRNQSPFPCPCHQDLRPFRPCRHPLHCVQDLVHNPEDLQGHPGPPSRHSSDTCCVGLRNSEDHQGAVRCPCPAQSVGGSSGPPCTPQAVEGAQASQNSSQSHGRTRGPPSTGSCSTVGPHRF